MFSPANTGFMLLAASLVMLMTPGLAFFYGGLVGRSNTLSIMIQSFASMGITTVMWWLIGFSLCFSGGADGIYGNFHLALLRHVGVDELYKPSGIPLTVLIAYQMMFAIITPALITGAFTNRVTFKSYLLFLICGRCSSTTRSCTCCGAAACSRTGACGTSPVGSSFTPARASRRSPP